MDRVIFTRNYLTGSFILGMTFVLGTVTGCESVDDSQGYDELEVKAAKSTQALTGSSALNATETPLTAEFCASKYTIPGTPKIELGLCIANDEAYGPFSDAMREACITHEGGSACTQIDAPWDAEFAKQLKIEVCEGGVKAIGICVIDGKAYGPFSTAMRENCVQHGGGSPCTTINAAWHVEFAKQIKIATCDGGVKELDICMFDGQAYGPFSDDMREMCTERNGGKPCVTLNAPWDVEFAKQIKIATCDGGEKEIEICIFDGEAYGPFSDAMREMCTDHGGGKACMTPNASWDKEFAKQIKIATCDGGKKEIGICVIEDRSYGPFSDAMIRQCKKYANGAAWGKSCDNESWNVEFAYRVKVALCEGGVRRNGLCIFGDKAYGPFSTEMRNECIRRNGGSPCTREFGPWSASFAISIAQSLSQPAVVDNPYEPPSSGGKNKLRIVQLGDSYSAGPGAEWEEWGRQFNRMAQYENSGTTPECYNSSGNWARRYVQSLRNAGIDVEYSSYACTGAVAADIHAHAQETANGHWPMAQVKRSGLNKETDLVFLTIGGNDVEFADIVTNCYVIYNLVPAFPYLDLPGLGGWKTCQKLLAKNAELLKNNVIKDRIITTLLAIGEAAPKAKIVLVEYPYLDRDYARWPQKPNPIPGNLRTEILNAGSNYLTEQRKIPLTIKNLADKLVKQQRSAVVEANNKLGGRVIYFDRVKETFRNHEACPGRTLGCAGEDSDPWIYDYMAYHAFIKGAIEEIGKQIASSDEANTIPSPVWIIRNLFDPSNRNSPFEPQKVKMYHLSPTGHKALANLLVDYDTKYGGGIFGTGVYYPKSSTSTSEDDGASGGGGGGVTVHPTPVRPSLPS